jgi:hypothetical protein
MEIYETFRFNLKKLNKVEDKEQYYVEIKNRFTALENLDNEVDINSPWETIREYQQFSQRESRLLRIEEA